MTVERRGIFSAWGYHQYRLLWASLFAANTARWMEVLVVAWLVLEVTNSPFMVGLAAALRSAGMVAGPFCGIIADRFDRRKTLAIVQLGWAIGSLTIMTLFFLSRLEVWHLLVYVLITGISHAFDFSTQFALAADIVESRHLTNAISLLFVTSTFAGGIGPLLGGSVLELIHASGAFALMSAGLLLSSLMLFLIRIERREEPVRREAAWSSLIQGFRYIAREKALLTLILIAALLNLFIAPIKQTLMPVFARDTLHVGAGGFGQVMAATGLGGLLGSLASGTLERFGNKTRLFIVGIAVWPTVYMLLAVSNLFYVSILLFFIAGAAEGFTYALLQALLIKRSSPEMRGRVSGIRAFAISPLFLGNLLTGAAAGLWGAPTALFTTSLAFLTVCMITVMWAVGMWKVK